MKIFSFLRKPNLMAHIALSLDEAKFDLLHAEDALAEATLRTTYFTQKISRLRVKLEQLQTEEALDEAKLKQNVGAEKPPPKTL